MTQVLQVKASSKLTGCLPKMCKLEAIADGSILKLSSSSHTFYLVYSPTVSQQHRLIELSKEFLKCNSIPEGFYKVQEVVAKDIKELKVMVSKRDWEIINTTANAIEQQFLGQAKLAWDGLVIPFHYTQTSYVKINCICDKGVWRLRENSRINVDFQQQKQNAEVKPFERLCFTMKENPMVELHQGYNDTLLVDERHFQQTLKQNTYYIAESNELIPEQSIIHFQEYIKTSSKTSDEKQNKNKPTKWLLRFGRRKLEDRTTAICSKVFSDLYQLPRNIILKSQFQQKDKDVCLTNEIFVSHSNKIQVFFLPIRPGFQHTPHHLQQILQLLLHSSSLLFVHGRLFYLEGEFFLTRIEKFEKQKNTTDVIDSLMIKKVRDFSQTEQMRKKFLQDCKKKVFICDQHLYDLTITEPERAYLNKVINTYKQREGIEKRSKEVSRLFQTFYQDQIKKLFECISKKTHVILYSPNKNGKTFTCHYLKSRDYPVFYVDFEEIAGDTSHRIKDVIEYLELVFSTQGASSIIFLDNINALCKVVTKDLNRQHEFIASRVLSRQLIRFVQLFCQQTCILVAQNPDNIDEQLKNIETTNIILKNPQTESRRLYFENVSQSKEQAAILVKNTESMNFGQILGIVSDKQKTKELIMKASAGKDKKEVVHDFTRIAGLGKAKSTIVETMQAPFKYSYLYKDLPIKMPKGVLLYGPSGVGKTYLATAVRQQVRMRFFEFKGSDILNMYIGASEQAVRDIFEKAMSVSPSIVFFDEFESIVPKRTANNTGVTDRIVNQFLCYLDGVSSLEGVFILAASSRPDMIDPALLRPGRIDKHIYLEYPDESQRLQLLKIYKEAITFQEEQQSIVTKTENYSYSDLVGLMKQLRIKKANRLLKQTPVNTEEFKIISSEFFDEIQKSYRISTSVEQQKSQKRRYELFARGEADSIEQQRIALK